MMNEYDGIAEIYDLDIGKKDSDVAFYSDCCKDANDVLILGAGTGREALFLAGIADNIVALDISERMIAVGRQRCAQAGIRNVTFLLGDMKIFSIENKFDRIIAPNSALIHLLRLEDIRACLMVCRRHLRLAGKLIIDFFRPDFRVLGEPVSPYLHDFTKQVDPETTFSRYRQHYRDMISQINTTQLFYETVHKGCVKKTFFEYKTRYIFPDEMRLLLEVTGYKVLDEFGTFEKEPIAIENHDFICISQATPGPAE